MIAGWRFSRSLRRGEDRGAGMELAAATGESSQVSDRDGERPPDQPLPPLPREPDARDTHGSELDAGGVESGLVPPGERPAIREILSMMRRSSPSAIGGGGGGG